MREMKDSGIEWIGKIPSRWETVRIKSIATNANDKSAFDGKYYIGLENIEPWTGKILDRSSIDDNEVDSVVTHFDDSSLLFGKLRPYLAKVARPTETGQCSTEILSLKAKNINKDFLFWNLLCYRFIDTVNSYTFGVKMPRANWECIGKTRIPFPDISEQKRIADYLDTKCSKIDEIIAKQEQIIEKLKEYKLSVITEAVTKGLDSNVEMKDSGVEWIGTVPRCWQIMNLGMVSNDIRNGYVGPTRDILVDSGVPYIQSLHVKDGEISFEKAKYFVTEEWGRKHPKVEEGQLVIVQTGDIGQVGLVKEEMSGFNCHALIIVTLDRNTIDPKYLQYYLRSKPGKELMLQTSTGALLPHLNSGKVKSTTILCPPIMEQKKISEYLDRKCSIIDGIIETESCIVQKAQEYKKSLIYEVVTGKKEV